MGGRGERAHAIVGWEAARPRADSQATHQTVELRKIRDAFQSWSPLLLLVQHRPPEPVRGFCDGLAERERQGTAGPQHVSQSEERRVRKECRSRWAPDP